VSSPQTKTIKFAKTVTVPLDEITDPMMRLAARLKYQAKQFEKRNTPRAKANAALIREELSFLMG
jgi:hypothetical protein